MRQLRLTIVVGILVGGTLGCTISPADQENIRRVWAERDAERARECERARGYWVAGACSFGGGS